MGENHVQRIRSRYPEEKPIAFNYAEARRELLFLADRADRLQRRLPEGHRPENCDEGD